MPKSIAPEFAEVKAMREEQSIGLQEAKRILLRRNARAAIREAGTLDELKTVLDEMFEHGLI